MLQSNKYYSTNYLTNYTSRVILEKLTVPYLVKKCRDFIKPKDSLQCTQHSTSFFPIQRQIIPVHNLPFYFSNTNFQLILPPAPKNLNKLITKTLHHEHISKMPLKLTLTTVCMLQEIKMTPSPPHWFNNFSRYVKQATL
jgi:hypothetical protein